MFVVFVVVISLVILDFLRIIVVVYVLKVYGSDFNLGFLILVDGAVNIVFSAGSSFVYSGFFVF